MINLSKFTILGICLNFLIVNSLFSQAERELNPPDYIKTISFKTSNENYSTNLPIIKLGETFTLDFDVLLNSEADYYYTIDQLNFDWSKSQLIKSEYLTGFDSPITYIMYVSHLYALYTYIHVPHIGDICIYHAFYDSLAGNMAN